MTSYKVGVSPHVHSKRTTSAVMLDVVIAMMPILIASVLIFGMRSLLLTAVSVSACVLLEFLWNKFMKTEITVGDLSAVVTGMLVAFNVPVSMPIWQLIVGDAVAIIVAKMLFGGLGCNFMNPALVGRIVMFFSFTGSMTDYSGHVTEFAKNTLFSINNYDFIIDITTGPTPLALEKIGEGNNFAFLLFGVHGGVLGETCALAIILGGVYLMVRRIITPTIPMAFLGGVIFFTWIFGGAEPILSIFTGGVMLGAFFMATDYVTSPNTETGKLVFALGCAFVTVMIRLFANSDEGVSFAILLMNVLVPYIDGVFKTKPFGGRSSE